MADPVRLIKINKSKLLDILNKLKKIENLTNNIANSVNEEQERKYMLSFAIDGRLLGDFGEYIAACLFNLDLVKPQQTGFDAYTKTNETVEIKLRTGNNPIDLSKIKAKYLVAMKIDITNCSIEILYHGKFDTKNRELPTICSPDKLKEHINDCEDVLMYNPKIKFSKNDLWHLI